MTTGRDHRRFPATPAGAAEVDSWLEEIGDRWRLSATALFRARVCVSEIAANALEHGGADADGAFAVAVEACGDRIAIEWSDDSRPFDPTAAAPAGADPQAPTVGGRGLALVRAYAHELTYTRERGRNIVRMRFPNAPCPVS